MILGPDGLVVEIDDAEHALTQQDVRLELRLGTTGNAEFTLRGRVTDMPAPVDRARRIHIRDRASGDLLFSGRSRKVKRALFGGGKVGDLSLTCVGFDEDLRQRITNEEGILIAGMPSASEQVQEVLATGDVNLQDDGPVPIDLRLRPKRNLLEAIYKRTGAIIWPTYREDDVAWNLVDRDQLTAAQGAALSLATAQDIEYEIDAKDTRRIQYVVAGAIDTALEFSGDGSQTVFPLSEGSDGGQAVLLLERDPDFVSSDDQAPLRAQAGHAELTALSSDGGDRFLVSLVVQDQAGGNARRVAVNVARVPPADHSVDLSEAWEQFGRAIVLSHPDIPDATLPGPASADAVAPDASDPYSYNLTQDAWELAWSGDSLTDWIERVHQMSDAEVSNFRAAFQSHPPIAGTVNYRVVNGLSVDGNSVRIGDTDADWVFHRSRQALVAASAPADGAIVRALVSGSIIESRSGGTGTVDALFEDEGLVAAAAGVTAQALLDANQNPAERIRVLVTVPNRVVFELGRRVPLSVADATSLGVLNPAATDVWIVSGMKLETVGRTGFEQIVTLDRSVFSPEFVEWWRLERR